MIRLLLISLLIFFTTSCDSIKKGFGLEKDPPDEFLIKKGNPIEVPPNYDLLPPNSKIKSIKKQSNSNSKNILDQNLKNHQSSGSEKKIDNQDTKTLEEDIIKEINK